MLWLSIIPRASSGCQPWLVDLNFEPMILVRTVAGFSLKCKHVKRIRVVNTGCDLAGHIVVRIENSASALVSKHLQCQVASLHVVCCRHSF